MVYGIYGIVVIVLSDVVSYVYVYVYVYVCVFVWCVWAVKEKFKTEDTITRRVISQNVRLMDHLVKQTK